jgi:hypothetical protein
VIVLAPRGNELVAILALPPCKVAVPTVVVPAVNVTVPVVETPVSVVTEAVKVTDWPCLEGFRDEVSVVVEAAGFTVSTSGDDVLLALLPSPL